MSNDPTTPIHSLSEAGVAAEHVPVEMPSILAAPTVEDRYNVLRPRFAPIACWAIGDARFKFSSSLVRPEIAEDVMSLAALVRGLEAKHGDRPAVSVFGHADPVGNESFNKALSGRRAAAIYASLTRRTDIWEDIFSQSGKFTSPLSADDWGDEAIDMMLTDLGYVASLGDEQTDADSASEPIDPVTAFQGDHGLVDDGVAGPNTRDKLFGAYMDKRCRTRRGEPFELDPADFLARGEDAAGKGDYQGCSEFNPLLRFSRDQHDELSKSDNRVERDAANEPNRRVVVFLFDPSVRTAPENWPCPRAKEGLSGCSKRLWADADDRSRPGSEQRRFEVTRDTFACRFYHRLARRSPCEMVSVRGFAVYLLDENHERLPGAEWRVRSGEDVLAKGTANDEAMALVPSAEVPDTVTLEWRAADGERDPSAPFEYVSEHFPLAGDEEADDNFEQMLANLGYDSSDDLSANVKDFQLDFALQPSGVLDDIREILRKWHTTGEAPLFEDTADELDDESILDPDECDLCGEEE